MESPIILLDAERETDVLGPIKLVALRVDWLELFGRTYGIEV